MSGANRGVPWPAWWHGFEACRGSRCRAAPGEPCISAWSGAILLRPHKGRQRIRDWDGWVAAAFGAPPTSRHSLS